MKKPVEHPLSIRIHAKTFSSSATIAAMSTKAVGSYVLLLFAAKKQQPIGSIPDNDSDLSEWSGITKREWMKIRDSVLVEFLFRNGRWHHKQERHRQSAHQIQKTHLSQFSQILETHSYRAAKAGVDDTLTIEQWGKVLLSTNWCCAWCGSGINIQVEHMIPISRGGGNTADNVCALCSSCNFNKGAKTPLEWICRK